MKQESFDWIELKALLKKWWKYGYNSNILSFVYNYNGEEKNLIFNRGKMSLVEAKKYFVEFCNFSDELTHDDYCIEKNPNGDSHVLNLSMDINVNALQIRLLTDKAISMFMLILNLMEEK